MPKTRKTKKVNLNKLVDTLIHPYFDEYPAMILIDGLLHAMIEQNPNESLTKFIKYNLPKLLKLHKNKYINRNQQNITKEK